MDSKLIVRAMLVITLLFGAVFVLILYTNGYIGPKKKSSSVQKSAVSTEESVEAVEKDGRIKGSDLDAWKSDNTFFDSKNHSGSKYTAKKEDEEIKPLMLKASSVEKDIRISILDTSGKRVEGQLFAVMVGENSEFFDDDRDGYIHVEDLKPGDYKVKLAAMDGFEVPSEAITCSVKAKIEYKAITDISYLIHTEDEIDAAKEDTGVNGAAEETSGSSVIRTDGSSRFGIDVSKHNGNIDWTRVKEAGVEYAIIRCGYRGSQSGSIVVDPYFETNMKGAEEAGIPVGVYFFTQAVNEAEAVEEASAVIDLVRPYSLTYPIFIDTEGAGGTGRADNLMVEDRSKIVKAFLETVKNSTNGKKPGIYASRNWYNKKLDMNMMPSGIVIWLAEYADSPTYVGDYQMWQYSSAGHIDGIDGRVDMNLSFLKVD